MTNKAFVIVLWLAFLVTPAVFAFRTQVRWVSIYPVGLLLAAGILLAYFGTQRTKVLTFQGFRLGVFLLIGGSLLLCSMALVSSAELVPNAAQVGSWLWSSREGMISQVASGFAPSNFGSYLFLLALTEGLWFRGLWFTMFPKQRWIAIGLGSVICAGWHAIVTHEMARTGYIGPSGLQLFAPMILAGFAFGIARYRGVSWLLIALVDSLLQCVLFGIYIGSSPICFGAAAKVAIYLLACLSLIAICWRWPMEEAPLPRKARLGIAALFIVFLITASAPVCWAILNSPFRIRPETRNQTWERAIGYFSVELPKRHLDFDRLMPRPQFDAEIAALRAKVPELSDDQIALELKRIVARLGVAHSGFDWSFPRFPIHFAWLSDGVVVFLASREYQEAIGARVVRFGPATPEEVKSKLAPYIPHENDAWLTIQLTEGEASNVTLLEKIGVISADKCLQLTLARPDNSEFTLNVWPAGPGFNWTPPEQAFMLPKVRVEGMRLKNYSAEYIREHLALYIQFRHCWEDPDYSFAAFEADLNSLQSQHAIERIIVDLRMNTGGTIGGVQSFLNVLKRSPLIGKKVHPLALTSNETFSGGVNTALSIKRELGGALIGRPTGGRPVYYANAKSFRLPFVDAAVRYSTLKIATMDTDAPSLNPDVYIPSTVSDFLTGRDAALEAAFNQPLSGR